MAANDATVDIIVEAANATGPLQRINVAAKKLSQSMAEAAQRLEKTNGTLRKTGQSATVASKGVDTLGKAVRNLLAIVGAVEATKFVFFAAADLQTQTKSLEVLTGSMEQAATIIAELKAFGNVTPFKSSDLVDTAKKLKAFGFETEEVVKVTKQLADVAGATGADLGGIATAFGQIEAKGRLQAEELMQLQERGVGLAQVLQREYGLTGEEFAKAMSKGQISADAVSAALEVLTTEGGEYFQGAVAQSETLNGKLSTLQDSFINLGEKIGTALEPAFKAAIENATTLLNTINAGIASLSLSEETRVGLQNEASSIVREQAGFMPGGAFGMGQVSIKANGKTYTGQPAQVTADISNDLIAATIQRQMEELTAAGVITGSKTPQTTTTTTRTEQQSNPFILTTGNTKKTTEKSTVLTAEEKELKRAAEQLRRLNEEHDAKIAKIEKQVLLSQALTSEERKQFERQIQIAEILENKKGLTQEQVKEELKIVTALYEAQDATAAIKEQNAQRLKQEEIANQQLEEQSRLVESIGQSIQTSITGAIMGAIDGTQSLNEALGDVLRNVGSLLINFGVGALGAGLKIPGFANGGRPTPNEISLVGERGPELFVPDRPGTVVPLDKGGAPKIPGFANGGRPKLNEISLVGEKGPELFVPDHLGTRVPLDKGGVPKIPDVPKIPGFANSGRPTPNEISLVGEKGPELFVPDRAGTVVPLDKGGIPKIPGVPKIPGALEIPNVLEIPNALETPNALEIPGASKIPGFANGGRPIPNQVSLVGERGPELFVPDRPSTVVRSGKSGEMMEETQIANNIVINVDASGSNVQGDEQSSRLLGGVIGAAVQAELVKQTRPGGLLAR